MTHHHQPELYAWEAILAVLSLSDEVHRAVDDHVGGCLHCWRAIAKKLAHETVEALCAALGEPDVSDDGSVTGDVVDWVGAMTRLAVTPPERLGDAA